MQPEEVGSVSRRNIISRNKTDIVWELLGPIISKFAQWVVPRTIYRHGFRVDAGEAKTQRGCRRKKWYACRHFFFQRGRVVVLIFADSRSSTLFVSNLPYTATSTDLKTLFSDIAPVRNAFVVLDHDTGISKGVGYVSFAIKEDVQLALEKISSEGLTIDGRSVRAQLAETRHKDKDHASTSGKNVDPEAKPAKAGKPRNPRGVGSVPKDPLAIRTVALSGLPPSIDAKVLWKKVRKQEGAEKVDWPVKLQTGEEDPTQGIYSPLPRLHGPGYLTGATILAYALFSDPQTVQDAVKKLHAHIFKGSIISATLKKRADSFQKPVTSTSTYASLSPAKSGTTPKLAPNRASRLIIRNLPFDIKEEDIKATFLPYGPIHSIDIPQTEDGRAKGFAFVWMMSKGDAQRALEKCNGTKIRAGVAEQLVQAKQKKKKQVRIEEKMSKEKAREEQDKAEEVAGTERVIAVDWALSKDRWEEEKAKMEVDEGVEMADGDSDSGEGSEPESESGSDEEGDSDSEEGSGDSSEGEDEDENRQKPRLPAPEAGTTLFVRNIPFEATEDELRVLWVVSSHHVLTRRSRDHTVSARLARSVMHVSRRTTRRVDPRARVSSASGTSNTRTRPSRRAISCA